MKKTFCDNCGKEVEEPCCKLLRNIPYGDQRRTMRIAVDFSFSWTSAEGLPKPELCLSCQVKLLRDFADIVEQG